MEYSNCEDVSRFKCLLWFTVEDEDREDHGLRPEPGDGGNDKIGKRQIVLLWKRKHQASVHCYDSIITIYLQFEDVLG